MAEIDIDIVAENLAELLTNTVDMASVFYDIFLNPNPMLIHLKAFDKENELIDVTIPNRAMDRITPYTGEGSPEGKVAAPIGSVYVDTKSSTVYYKVSGNESDPFGWNAVISQSLMETFIRTYLEARGYVTTSSLHTYLVTHDYVDLSYMESYLTENGYVRGRNLSSVLVANPDDTMILVDGDSEDVNGVAFGNLMASMISSDPGNILENGSDNRLLVSNGATGVVAGTYAYPKNLTVNDSGRITSVEQGSEAAITLATDVNYGIVRPDNSTITVHDGVISAVSRCVGEIVPSTIPLEDAGLHLLDGSLIVGSGMYLDFYNYIKNLYNSGSYSSLFVSEANWQSAVAQYGVCDKFVYDSANNTVRLPKYGNQIITKTSATSTASTVPVVGNGMTLGLTNGTNLVGLNSSAVQSNRDMFTAAAYGVSVSTSSDSQTGYVGHYGVTSDSTKSGLVADISSIKNYPLDCYYYIVVANVVKSAIQVDLDKVAADLNGKADKDLLNANITKAFANVMNAKGIRTVVDTFVSGSDSGYRWYRVWSDGWCEQGGTMGSISAGVNSVNLMKNLKANYCVYLQRFVNRSSLRFYDVYVRSRSSSSFSIYTPHGAPSDEYIFWQACGQMA